MATLIQTWLKFSIQQMASEAYLDQFLPGPGSLVEVLTNGNNNEDVIPIDQFNGKTRFVDLASVCISEVQCATIYTYLIRIFRSAAHHARRLRCVTVKG
jgi:hypothetical protein